MGPLSTLSPDGHGLAVAHGSVVWLSERLPRAPLANATMTSGLRPFAPRAVPMASQAAVLELPAPAVGLAHDGFRVYAMTLDGRLLRADRKGHLDVRRRIGSRGVGVGYHDDHVVAFTDEGWLRWRIGNDQGVYWGRERTTHVPQLNAGACASDGRIAVLTKHTLQIYDEQDRRSASIPLQAGGIVISGGPAGWFVVAGEQVHQVTSGGRVRAIVASDAPITCIAATPDGRTLAVGMGPEVVALWNVIERVPEARFQLFGRHVVGVSFATARWLGIGLDQGDGHWVDLRETRLVRNEPPPGAVRRTWRVAVVPDPPTAVPRRGVNPEDTTIAEAHGGSFEASLRSIEVPWRRPPHRSPWPMWSLVTLAVVGLITGWMMGQAVVP